MLSTHSQDTQHFSFSSVPYVPFLPASLQGAWSAVKRSALGHPLTVQGRRRTRWCLQQPPELSSPSDSAKGTRGFRGAGSGCQVSVVHHCSLGEDSLHPHRRSQGSEEFAVTQLCCALIPCGRHTEMHGMLGPASGSAHAPTSCDPSPPR